MAAPAPSSGAPAASDAPGVEAQGRLGRLRPLALWLALGALALKLYLNATTVGTNDCLNFLRFLQEYRGSGAAVLYAKDPYMNHPPFMLRVLQGMRFLWLQTGIPWQFWLRLPSIAADLGIVLLLGALLRDELAPSREGRAYRVGLCLVAAAPASILVSGFHGNTDAVMLFFTLLSVLWARRSERAWLAGAAMGMALNVKVVPLMFWPAFFLWLPDWRTRLRFFATALLVVFAGSLPAILEAPRAIAVRVLGYPSNFGMWGLSRLAVSIPSLHEVAVLFSSYGRWFLALGLLLLAVWMNWRVRKPPLYRQVGLLVCAFLAFTPGFGVQYLIWLVPWLAGLPLLPVVAFLAVSGAFLLLVYAFWCQDVRFGPAVTDWLDPSFWSRGRPWRYADATQWADWPKSIVAVEVACWLTVVCLLVCFVRSVRSDPTGGGRSTARAT